MNSLVARAMLWYGNNSWQPLRIHRTNTKKLSHTAIAMSDLVMCAVLCDVSDFSYVSCCWNKQSCDACNAVMWTMSISELLLERARFVMCNTVNSADMRAAVEEGILWRILQADIKGAICELPLKRTIFKCDVCGAVGWAMLMFELLWREQSSSLFEIN